MKTILTTAVLLLLFQEAPRITTIPGATVEGRVLYPDNSPAANMTVEALQQAFNPDLYGARQWWLTSDRGRAVTDDSGQFRIVGLGPGKYYLRAIKRSATAGGASIAASSIAWTPTTYFPGMLNAALASPFDIKAGQSVKVDIAIPQSNPYTVSGKVLNSVPGQPPQQIQLVLTRRDYGAPIETFSASLETLNLPVSGDGKFEIRGVPSGSYELFATMRAARTNAGPTGPNLTWIARTTFDIADQDIDNISLVLRPGVDLKGKLTVQGNSSGLNHSLSLRANDGSPAEGFHFPRIEGETFVFDNVPEGSYSITVSTRGERGAHVADIRSASRSIFGESIVVGSSSPEPIEVVLNTNGVSVPITVSGTTDNPPTVVLVPQPPHRKNPHRYWRTTVNDPSGRVTVDQVAPGEYTVYAWDYPTTFPVPYMDPQFIVKYGTRGVQVNVTGQPLPSVEVPVVRVNPFD